MDKQTDLVNTVITKFEEHETFFYWHANTEQVCFGKNEDMREQMKIWKHQKKQGILQVLEENNKTFEIQGKKFYSLVIQDTNPDRNPFIDPLAMGVGMFVSGFVYFFKRKHNRDAVFDYLNKEAKKN